ncbi:MAG: hypothetical protein K0V04_01990, partial [Deltaproteobacteria bacterium]|nr:hypothetical protein [Deltaproteobacteria bacterium]
MPERWSYDWGRRSSPRPELDELQQRLGRDPEPVSGEGRTFVATFWGKAWCANLERYRDYANRLPRGRTYLRKGLVLDLAIDRGQVTALVMGSELYEVRVKIGAVAAKRWGALRKACAGGLSSVVELLGGRISDDVMEAVTAAGTGLFPEPQDIELDCSCPDWATMCKHVAAALYGVGVRLDQQPDLLFVLRGVDPEQLVGSTNELVREVAFERQLSGDLSDIFGVHISDAQPSEGGGSVKNGAGKKGAVSKKKAASKKKAVGAKKAASKKKAVGASKQKSVGTKKAASKQKVVGTKKAASKQKAVGAKKAASKQKVVGAKKAVSKKTVAGKKKAASNQKAVGTKKAASKQKAVGAKKAVSAKTVAGKKKAVSAKT